MGQEVKKTREWKFVDAVGNKNSRLGILFEREQKSGSVFLTFPTFGDFSCCCGLTDYCFSRQRAALAEAQEELDVVMAQLKDAKARLASTQKRLAELQKGFDDAVANKQELEQKAERCVVQLSNAEKLIGGLGGEEKRWKETVATLTLAMDKLPGEARFQTTASFPLPIRPTFRFLMSLFSRKIYIR